MCCRLRGSCVCVQAVGDTHASTAMTAAVSQGLWEVVEALVLRGVKLTTSEVSYIKDSIKCTYIY